MNHFVAPTISPLLSCMCGQVILGDGDTRQQWIFPCQYFFQSAFTTVKYKVSHVTSSMSRCPYSHVVESEVSSVGAEQSAATERERRTRPRALCEPLTLLLTSLCSTQSPPSTHFIVPSTFPMSGDSHYCFPNLDRYFEVKLNWNFPFGVFFLTCSPSGHSISKCSSDFQIKYMAAKMDLPILIVRLKMTN